MDVFSRDIVQVQPPAVIQTLDDSCWAACLQAWTRADHRLGPWLNEMELVEKYGETPTGGITPEIAYPKFRARWKVWADAYQSSALVRLIEEELPSSHMMCAHYSTAGKWHAVLIWKVTKAGRVYFMDPQQKPPHGLRVEPISYLQHGAIARVSLK